MPCNIDQRGRSVRSIWGWLMVAVAAAGLLGWIVGWWVWVEQHIDYMLSKIPMGRFGRKEEAAALVAWLCAEDCSFTTASVFDLSGGRATY